MSNSNQLETNDNYEEVIEKTLREAYVPEKKINLSKPAIAVISSVATLVVCVIIVAVLGLSSYNPYNANKKGYLPTLNDLAQEYDMSLDELKEAYSLPDNMRGDTVAAIATMYMPAGLYVEMYYGYPFDMAVQMFGLSGDPRITTDMPYGEFEKILSEVETPEATEAPADGETIPAEGETTPAEGETAPVPAE